MTGIADMGNVCSEVGVGPKEAEEFFMSKNRSRRTLKDEIREIRGNMWDGKI